MTPAGPILVVDDQAASLVALRTVLEPLGRPVVTATSGEDALKRLLTEDFAVIVMDVRMPGLDGFETVELIKRRHRHEDTAVIFLTAGDADAEQITRGYSAGAVDYILKPVDADVLRSKVAMLLELQQKNAELRASEERFRAAFEGAPIGMGLSTIDGRWLEVNDALCELLGRTQSQLLDKPLWEMAHPADRDEELDAVRRLLRERPLFAQSEKRFMRHNGEVVHAIVSVSLTADGHDRPQGYIWQLVDVTEQRRAEAERAARAEAEAVAMTIGKLQQVTEAALEHLELRDLLDVLVERLSEVFAADIVRILLQDFEDDQLYAVGAAAGLDDVEPGTPVEIGDALAQVVLASRSVTLQELPEGGGLDTMMAAAGVGSLMASPLVVKGRFAGVVEVAMRSPRPFTLEEESLLILMADRAGLAIEHARAYEREVSNVELLQRSLLPDRLPEVDGIQIAARYMPGGAKVGGDWYDAIPLDGGRVGVAMGDVVGHGIGAASLMGQLRHATRAYALEGHSPAGVLDRLDRLVRSLDGGQMATLLYLVVEPDHGTVHFASAGHVPPLAIGPDGDAQYLASAPNPPLGVFESDGHVELSVKLPPGSTVVLYTDGLVEERGVSIDQGLDALRLAAAQDTCHPDELCDRLVEAMLAIHPANDDIAVLALRALPTAPPPLHLDMPSDPNELGKMRRELGSWLRSAGASSEVVEIVQIACHEACSNSIEHGYSFGDGKLSVDAELDQRVVVLTIRDTGGWVERPDGNLPYRGNGLPMMEALMDSVEFTHGNGAGTAVRMARSLSPAPAPYRVAAEA
jgi:PAS domain S-box-containing protein